MLCKKPYMQGLHPRGCGQCLKCRVDKSRLWSHRIMLETRAHADSTFITLTYRDEEIEDISEKWSGDRPVIGNLVPVHAKKFIKNLVRNVGTPLRYFLVGEYGDRTGRPHYHLALFGFPNCIYGKTRLQNAPCCGPCKKVADTWKRGNVFLGELNNKSAQYISGYVVKKWTKEDQWTKQKLKGRRPEFSRMSLKPGIGAPVISNLINFTERIPGKVQILKQCLDAPVVLRNSGSTLPLGRYLRRKWREALGRSPDTPRSVVQEHDKEVSKLWKKKKEKLLDSGVPGCFISPGSEYEKENRQKLKNFEARQKIFAQEKII